MLTRKQRRSVAICRKEIEDAKPEDRGWMQGDARRDAERVEQLKSSGDCRLTTH